MYGITSNIYIISFFHVKNLLHKIFIQNVCRLSAKEEERISVILFFCVNFSYCNNTLIIRNKLEFPIFVIRDQSRVAEICHGWQKRDRRKYSDSNINRRLVSWTHYLTFVYALIKFKLTKGVGLYIIFISRFVITSFDYLFLDINELFDVLVWK